MGKSVQDGRSGDRVSKAGSGRWPRHEWAVVVRSERGGEATKRSAAPTVVASSERYEARKRAELEL